MNITTGLSLVDERDLRPVPIYIVNASARVGTGNLKFFQKWCFA